MTKKILYKIETFFERVESSFDDGMPTSKGDILRFVLACAGAAVMFYFVVVAAFLLG